MTTTKRHVLVTGATGQQGGAVVNELLKRGHSVRAITRNTESVSALALSGRGVEVVKAEFSDHRSLVQAMKGVDTIFAMTTPFEAGVDAETNQGLALVDAAKVAGVGHLIYSSVADANRKTGIPHFESKFKVEQAIASSGINHTIIAPVYFMDNVRMPSMAPNAEGVLSLPMPAGRVLQQIAVENIGQFAATMVERREDVFGRRIDIAGDEITGDQMAAILSLATGRAIQFQGFPPDAMRAHSEDLALMFEWFDAVGYSADIAQLRSEFPEVKWVDYATWAGSQSWDAAGTK